MVKEQLNVVRFEYYVRFREFHSSFHRTKAVYLLTSEYPGTGETEGVVENTTCIVLHCTYSSTANCTKTF